MKSDRTFEHNGYSFTVRERTEMDEYLYNSLLIDTGRLILKAKGYDIDKDYPRALDALITRFARWMQLTSGTAPYMVNLLSFKADDVGKFDEWVSAVTEDAQLATQWKAWVEAVNHEQTDPLAETSVTHNGKA